MAHQVGRSAAGASRFAASKVDWARLFKLSGSNTTTVANLQAKWAQASMKMNSFSDALPKIDFSYYRRMVSDPSLIDKLQKEYETVQIPAAQDTANRFGELDEYAKSEQKRAQDFINVAESEIKQLKTEFERWDNVPPADQVTSELMAFYMPEAVFPRVWDKDEHDKMKDIQFYPYQKRDSLKWWVEQGGELLPHSHGWIQPEEALDPIGAPARPKTALASGGHGDGKSHAAGGKH